MFHLDPPLKVVPEGDWFCPVCISTEAAAGKDGFASEEVRVR